MASSRGRWASPERTMVWTEPPKAARRAQGKVPVVYYLCRNGQLDHPHFMEVTLSSPEGLYLRDVMERLNVLRGDGMASMYSWSSKRSYKNGYVWHDLTDDDLVHPAHGSEYVLKGSELLALPPRPRDASASSSSSSAQSREMTPPAAARAGRRKNWSSFDLGEYRVAVRSAELSAADAATQTDDRRGGRYRKPAEPTTELGIDEISPPPSSSSPDTLETLIKNDARIAAAAAAAVAPQCEVPDSSKDDVGVSLGGRMRASAVLMQLISCGSITVKDGTATGGAARYTERLPRGRSDLSTTADGIAMDREYFSGSLIETKKATDRGGDHADAGELAALKRSSSYNADRVAVNKLELAEEEVDGVRARCIPRKPKAAAGAGGRSRNQPDQDH